MVLDDAQADGQSQPTALAHHFGAEEGVKQFIGNIALNAHTLVRHNDFDTLLIDQLGDEQDLFILFTGMDGIH